MAKLQNDKYSVVRFITEKRKPSMVVPNIWIHAEEGQNYCYFPKNLTGARLLEAVHTPLRPDPSNVRAWWDKMIFIKFRNGTEEKCNAKLEKYVNDEETTGIDTDIGMPDESDDEDDEGQENSILSIRAALKNKRPAETDRGSEEEGSSAESQSSKEKSGKLSETPVSNDIGNTPGTSASGSTQQDSSEDKSASTKYDKRFRKCFRNQEFLKKQLQELTNIVHQALGVHSMKSGGDVVPGFSLPLKNPDQVKAFEEAIAGNAGLIKNLREYLTVKGSSPSSSWEGASSVLGAVFSDVCGYFFNLKGQRCKGDSIVAEDSKKIGVNKAFPTLYKVIEDTFTNISEAEKKRISVAQLMASAGRWLTKRIDSVKKLPEGVPELPWVWGSSERVVAAEEA